MPTKPFWPTSFAFGAGSVLIYNVLLSYLESQGAKREQSQYSLLPEQIHMCYSNNIAWCSSVLVPHKSCRKVSKGDYNKSSVRFTLALLTE